MNISVILLTYNQSNLATEHLRSLLAQDYKGDWEIIVSDDASDDNTFEQIQQVVKNEGKNHNIILNKNTTNKGIAGNLQSAIELSSGEWIIKCDGDDISRHDRISELVKLTQTYPGYLMYNHKHLDIDEHGSILNPLSNREDVKGDIIYSYKKCIHSISHIYCPMFGMYHRSLFTDFPPLPSGKAIADDTILGFRAYLKKSGYVQSNKTLAYYRQHSNNICNFVETDPKEILIKRSHYACVTLSYEIAETSNQYRLGNLSYKEANRLLKLLHAEQQRLLLFPYASFDNNLLTKLKWYVTILNSRPELWLLSIPRLLPNFLVKIYLTGKEKIKKIIK